VSLSQCTSGENLWKCVYPKQGASAIADPDSVQLAPFHSANVVLYITEDRLRKYLLDRVRSTGCSHAEARTHLASTIQFIWKIVDPVVRDGVKEIANMTRIGKLSLLNVDESWESCLKLSQFSMSIRPPSALAAQGESTKSEPSSSCYLHLASRIFHRFVASIACSSSDQDAEEASRRRHVEVAFVVIDACDDSTTAGALGPSKSVHSPSSVIITGSPHKVLLVPDTAEGEYSVPLEHAVDICFSRCGLYHVFTFARYRSRLRGQAASTAGNGEERVSTWWTLREPVSIAVR
jgi:hypothetical protein